MILGKRNAKYEGKFIKMQSGRVKGYVVENYQNAVRVLILECDKRYHEPEDIVGCKILYPRGSTVFTVVERDDEVSRLMKLLERVMITRSI